MKNSYRKGAASAVPLALALLSATAILTIGDSVQVEVPADGAEGDGDGTRPLGWNFQPKTVANAFPSAADGTVLYFWDAGNQQYIVNQRVINIWTEPNYEIQTGEGFVYYNPTTSPLTVTLSGDAPTSTNAVTIQMQANKWYLLAYSFPLEIVPTESEGGNYIECISFWTANSLEYPAGVNDKVYKWIEMRDGGVLIGGWLEEAIRTTNSVPYVWDWWGGGTVSPKLPKGESFWFLPAGNRTWVQTATGAACP